MCGIAGIVSVSDRQLTSTAAVKSMATQMRNRGPDDEGYVYLDVESGEFRRLYGDDTCAESRENAEPVQKYEGGGICSNIILAHRRLSILDLSASGHQPMITEDGRYALVYNGEIYNFREIRQELESLGYRFRSATDSEVVLNAFAQWGGECVNRFNGMFAFAVWDAKKENLTLARDRVGIKPLYYVSRKGFLIFGSDIKTIIASGQYVPELDLTALHHFLGFGVTPKPMTLFKDVYSLEPGTVATVDRDGSIRNQKYWTIPAGGERDIDYSEAKELVEDELGKSIKRRLVADVSVGTFMSGGVDSTLISTMASSMHPEILAFTLGYEGESSEFDEVSQASDTAKMHGIRHIIQRVNPEIALESLYEMAICYEEPFYSLSPNFIISKLASENGVKVVLNGLGGDEIFSGYSWYHWISRWQYLRKFSPAFSMFAGMRGRAAKIAEVAAAKNAMELHTALYSNFTEVEKRKLIRSYSEVESTHDMMVRNYDLGSYCCRDEHIAMAVMDFLNYIGNHHVNRVDQFTMHFSLEGRFPFLDHEFIEMAFSLSTAYKYRNGKGKRVLRDVAKKWIAPSCLSGEKKGFQLPMANWMRGRLSEHVRNRLEALKTRDIFDAHEIDAYHSGFLRGAVSYPKVWQLVAFEEWCRIFLDKPFENFIHGNKELVLASSREYT